jgi:hypothetical protein
MSRPHAPRPIAAQEGLQHALQKKENEEKAARDAAEREERERRELEQRMREERDRERLEREKAAPTVQLGNDGDLLDDMDF